MLRYALVLTGILAFGTAVGQTCVPGGEVDGPVDTVHSAVKKLGDSVTLTWTDPAFTTDCEPLTGPLALTALEVYISLNAPVDTANFTPDATVAPGVETLTFTINAPRKSDVYYAVRARNGADATDVSTLSNQPFVKVPGTPQPVDNATVN